MRKPSDPEAVDASQRIGLWPLRAIFKDPIHRIIPVNNLEYYIIQHPIFNRLHGIRQLGFSYLVYPQAKHTRFEHSLGSMHLASIVALAFRRNSPELAKKLVKPRRSYDNFVQLARISALLHDLGHLPFSHITEELIEDAFKKGLLSQKMEAFVKTFAKERPVHEAITCELIKKLRRDVERDFKSQKKKISPIFGALLYALCGEKNSDWSKSFTISGVKVAKSIISGRVTDVDRMDYLVRDAYNTGATYGAIDIERLAEGLMLREMEKEIVVVAPSKIISNIEELYYARYMMYKWVYQHHMTIALDLTYKKALSKIADEWGEIRKRVAKILPSPPQSLWDLFHPDNIWKYTVRKHLRVDDTLVETIMRISLTINSSSGEWSRRLLSRKPIYHPVIKRQEDLIGFINEALARKKIDKSPTQLLASLRKIVSDEGPLLSDLKKMKSLRENSEEVERCLKDNSGRKEAIECILEYALEKNVSKITKRAVGIKMYIAPPISTKLTEQPLILAEKNVLPLTEASLIIKSVYEAGLNPMFYVYYTLPRRNKRIAELIRTELSEILVEMVESVEGL